MANNKMLIDASHPEETRVVVLRGNRIEEFDFESANKKPLRGNIYLAKVTRVEPSLQAAFIEYGGNRHGFLAFSEIHPDYYQIPVADRQALLEEEARQRRDEEDEEENRRNRPRPQPQQQEQQRRSRRFRGRNDRNAQRASNGDEVIAGDAPQPDLDISQEGLVSSVDMTLADAEIAHGSVTSGESTPAHQLANADAGDFFTRDVSPSAAHETSAHGSTEAVATSHNFDSPTEALQQDNVPLAAHREHSDVHVDTAEVSQHENLASEENRDHIASAGSEANDITDRAIPGEPGDGESEESLEDGSDEGDEEEEVVEQLGGVELDEMARPQRRSRRQYKIQEVIKRRQVLLVQVVKEERGNKGAALTTYLSLAGRYSVLMPNTARGGGISRKITDNEDRKRLREIAGGLDVPEGMGIILRTAGAARGKEEVQRDFEYLLRMWESVRELTLRSIAPTQVYEEGSLIKRSIRDLYSKEIDEVLVAGGEGYKEARDFMGMLMPSHVGNVREWKEQQPVFAKYGVEQQLDSMFSNIVTLKSGGYIVVNQTEALVAIDVNSGRSTREHNIEDTALRTNLEAADEVARQLRLRDLAGLIVIDFIDMEEFRNNRSVERRMKDALKNDRARIQVGRISHFGLLEMSRQRMRTGVLEGSSVVCQHCLGAGTVRSTASIALHVLRLIEDALIRNDQFNMTVRTRTEIALYILNQKRVHLRDLEDRFGIILTIAADDALTGSNYHGLERGEPAIPLIIAPQSRPQQIQVDSIAPVYDDEDSADGEEADDISEPTVADEVEDEGASSAAGSDTESEDARRRKRRRRGGRNRESSGIEADAPQPSDHALSVVANNIEIPAQRAQTSAAAQDVEEGGEDVTARTPVEGESEGNPRSRRNGRRRRGGRGRDGDLRPRSGDEEGAAQPSGNWVRTQDHGDSPASESAGATRAEADTTTGNWTPVAVDAPIAEQAVVQSQVPARELNGEHVGDGHARQPENMASPPNVVVSALVNPPAQTLGDTSSTEIKQTEPKSEDAKSIEAKSEEPKEPKSNEQARQIETLPEAPAPAQKRGGWWQRARNALGG